MSGFVEVLQDLDGNWTWRLRDAGGAVVLQSSDRWPARSFAWNDAVTRNSGMNVVDAQP